MIVTWSAPHPECKGGDFESIRSEWGCKCGGSGRTAEPRRRDLLHDGRRGLAAHPALPGRDDRLRRPPARRLPPPPAVGHVPEGARPLLPRARPVSARGSGPPHDRRPRPRLRPLRPRRGPRRRLRGSRALRPGDRHRRGGLQRADPPGPRDLPGHRQRQAGLARGRMDRCETRADPPARPGRGNATHTMEMPADRTRRGR